jgi:hypothetical protein
VTSVPAKRAATSEKQYQTPADLARDCRFFVGPRLGSGGDIGAVDRLGFLGSRLFHCKDPRFWGLDFLGFPWILSSESRLINGLRWIFREENFARPFAAGAAPPGQESVFIRCGNAVRAIE